MNTDITRLLGSIRVGDKSAANELLSLIYSELRQIAAAKMQQRLAGQTLHATSLVHEAWMRLVDTNERLVENRAPFFSAAAEAMRCLLVDYARRKNGDKSAGGAEHGDLEALEIAVPIGTHDELLAVHETLDKLAAHDARKAELVKLRYFVGLSIEKAAEVLGISAPTANREWAFARAWLHAEISRNAPPAPRKSVEVVELSKEAPRDPFDERWTETWTRSGDTWTK